MESDLSGEDLQEHSSNDPGITARIAVVGRPAVDSSILSVAGAIRTMGAVTEEGLHLIRESDAIMQEELRATGYYDKVWQAFTVLLNVQSVGVMGDNRTYDNTVCIRMVESVDGMTATFAHVPHDVLEGMSRRIINEIDGINRVVYDISSKPPATIEWE